EGSMGNRRFLSDFLFPPFPEGCPLVSRVKTQEIQIIKLTTINTSIKKQLPPKNNYQPLSKRFKAAP
ncbi:MAG: hypothetical protein ACI4XA_10390, partial [Oscillospiraceae bacterium]